MNPSNAFSSYPGLVFHPPSLSLRTNRSAINPLSCAAHLSTTIFKNPNRSYLTHTRALLPISISLITKHVVQIHRSLVSRHVRHRRGDEPPTPLRSGKSLDRFPTTVMIYLTDLRVSFS